MGAEEDEEEIEIEQSAVSFREHAFQFEKFEQVRLPSAFSLLPLSPLDGERGLI
jgi:hypothetical protein